MLDINSYLMDMAGMDAEAAISKMWTYAEKPERMRCFHKIVFELGVEDDALFWDNFWQIWSASENLNEDAQYIRELVDAGKLLGPSLRLDDEDAEQFGSLPDTFTVYRGGIKANRLGWSWTLDREKAVWFAERAFGPPHRYLMSTVVQKSDALAFLTSRGESEIVLDPDTLAAVTIEQEFYSESNRSAGLFYMIQSGKEFGDEGLRNQFIAESMMRTVADADVGKYIAEMTEMSDFCKWAGLRAKLGYCEAALSLLKERQVEMG